MRTWRRINVYLTALLICAFLAGCTSPPDDSAAWLELGADILASEAEAAIPRGIYMDPPEWVESSLSANVDRESMPAWATDQYSICVHWQRQYTRMEINQNRSSGEPQRWAITGEAEGWILLADEAYHILSLTLTEQGKAQPEVIEVKDAWDSP